MPQDDVEKFLASQKQLEDERKAIIEGLLKKREAQNKEIDDQLAKLGYQADGTKPKRTHHAKPPAVKPSAIKAKDKDKATS